MQSYGRGSYAVAFVENVEKMEENAFHPAKNQISA